MVGQNSSHYLRGNAIKVGFVLPARLVLVDQAEICFIHQRGALQGVIGPLAAQVAGRKTFQFFVHEGYQRLERLIAALLPLFKS